MGDVEGRLRHQGPAGRRHQGARALKFPLYVVDAFTNRPFGGNPAAVVPLDHWLPDELMQAIAAENNLSETAFFIRDGANFTLRWFAPGGEVDLCGHATLATAFILFEELKYGATSVRFSSRSGPLDVKRDGAGLLMDFPRVPMAPCAVPKGLADGLGVKILSAFAGMDYVAVVESEAVLAELKPNIEAFRTLDLRGVVVTARGTSADYVCRCFAPRFGINEDPATGSAQCMLAPYWSAKLAKDKLNVRQVSARGGEMTVELRKERVLISGEARLYLKGDILL